jgi:hypothetical protein
MSCTFQRFVRSASYRGLFVPQWVVLLALAIAAWLLVAVGGGLLAGRALGLFSRLIGRLSPEQRKNAASRRALHPGRRRRAA